jgi:hypothetical protein
VHPREHQRVLVMAEAQTVVLATVLLWEEELSLLAGTL